MPELRETIELVTPVTKKTVVIKGYASGRIKQELEAIFMRDSVISTKFDEKGKSVSDNTAKLDGATIIEARNKAIELVVMSVDGMTDDILNRVLDLPEADWKFIREKVDEVTTPLAVKNEESSETATTTPSAEA